MEQAVNNFLVDIGCCWRCILIFLGQSDPKENFSRENLNSISTDVDENRVLEPDQEQTKGENYSSLSSESKKLKSFICVSCLGMLQNCDSLSTVQLISDAIKTGGFDDKSFSMSVTVPVCLPLRIHIIWAHLLKRFQEINHKPTRNNHVGVLKNVWRSIIGSKIAAQVDKIYITGQHNFSITIQAEYIDNDEECLLLEKLDPRTFHKRHKKRRKYMDGVFTLNAVKETLGKISDHHLLKRHHHLPHMPLTSASYKCQCSHTSMYVAGRYNKYSRTLPQTPWLVSDGCRFESSIQELICEPLNLFIKADGVKFSSSGREDVDIRCLGRGRPFVIEFTNPHKVEIGEEDLVMLEDRVNVAAVDVGIRDLQVISKKDVNNLKEIEDEKTKSYCALCFSHDIIPDKYLKDLELIKELSLDQSTPLRVLHRRPLSVKKGVIHSIRAEKIDDHIFKLYVNTQAGNYIKEFIHGDFGRTTPNLGMILGVKCDILALDIEDVLLDWPPKRNQATSL